MISTAGPAFVTLAVMGVLFLLWLFVTASFLLWGARIAGIPRRSYGRAFGTILLGGIASVLVTTFLSVTPPIGPGLGALLGFCVSALVMMAFFDTTFGKALAANILAWVLSLLVAIGLGLVLAILTAFLTAAG